MVRNLELIREGWAHTRQRMQQAFAKTGRMVAHVSLFNQMHAGLQLGYAVFLTYEENAEFNRQFTLALRRLAEFEEMTWPHEKPSEA